MPVARATSTTQHLGSTSILVPRHFQLEAPRAKYPCQVIGGAFSFMPQVTAKWLHGTLHKNLETPARHTGPRSNNSKPHIKTIAFTAFASATAPSFPTLLFSRTSSFKVVLALQCFTAATAQRSRHLHACCHTTLHQRDSKFHPQRMPCEDAQNLSATTRPVCCTSTCHLNLRPTMPQKMCVEGHSLAEMSRYKHVFLNHCTTVQHAEPRQPAAYHEVPYQSMSRCVVTWRSTTSVFPCTGEKHALKRWEVSPGYASRLSVQPLVRSVSGSSGCCERAFSENI